LLAGGATIAAAPHVLAETPEGDLEVAAIDGGRSATISIDKKVVFSMPARAFGRRALCKKLDKTSLLVLDIDFGSRTGAAPLYTLQLDFSRPTYQWEFSFRLTANGGGTPSIQSGGKPWTRFLRLAPAAAPAYALDDTGPSSSIFPVAEDNDDFFSEGTLLRSIAAKSPPGMKLALRPDLGFVWFHETKLIELEDWDIEAKALRFAHVQEGAGPLAGVSLDGKLPADSSFAVIAIGARFTKAATLIEHDKGDVRISAANGTSVKLGWQQWLKADKKTAALDATHLKGAAAVGVAWTDTDKKLGPRRSALPAGDGTVLRWRAAGGVSKLKGEFELPERFTLDFGFGRLGVAAIGDKSARRVRFAGAAAKPADTRIAVQDFNARLRFDELFRSIPGSDASEIRGTTEFVLIHAGSTTKRPDAFVALGQDATAKLKLDGGSIRIKRSADLLDLKYTFRSVDLVLEGPVGRLEARTTAPAEDSPRMAVELAPQHIAEQTYLRVDPAPSTTIANASPIVTIPDGTPLKDIQSRFPELRDALDPYIKAGTQNLTAQITADVIKANARASGDEIKKISRARLSGNTRVAFSFEPSSLGSCDAPTSPIPLTVAGLTAFAHLKPAVVQRARVFVPKDTPDANSLAAQELDFYGIKPDQSWDDRLNAIREQMKEPGKFDTAIEIPYRLILSPDDEAVWLTPQELPLPDNNGKCADETANSPRGQVRKPRRTALWHMELHQPKAGAPKWRGGVRAIWARDLDVNGIGNNDPRNQASQDDAVGYRTPLHRYDRQEIALLSSMHGLPVLRRSPIDGKLPESQIVPPPNYQLKDAGEWSKDTAIYKPAPLDVSELTLTALGGSLTLDSSFEPPVGIGRTKDERPSSLKFTVQRWRHKAALGRDLFVEVVYKGYLYPYGHDCSLVKVTERKFVKHERQHVAAYLIQRMFLRVGDPAKTYPAYLQPDGGRRFPARRIEIVTRQSADILDPTDETNATDDRGAGVAQRGRIVSVDGTTLVGVVCWPRDAAGNEIRFELQIDSDARTVSQPLIFVDFAAANTPETMAKLNAYYRRLSGEQVGDIATPDTADRRVVLKHGNVLRRYADETQAQDASFETVNWTVSADSLASWRGVAGEVTALPDNRFDALLLGANQPPFFPAIKSARIRLKQLERLSGTAAQEMEVTYFDDYLEKGFKETASEMYLHAADGKGVELSFTQSGNRSGGMSKPNASIVALSRTHGPVAKGDDKPLSDISAYAKFNPASFFQSDAKLLGLLKLSDILATFENEFKAPKLTQAIEYGLATAEGEVCTGLQNFAQTLQKKLQLPKEFNEDSLKNVYADFFGAWKSFQEKAKALGDNKDECFIEAGALYEAGRKLIDIVARIAAEPAGPLLAAAKTELEKLQQATEALPTLSAIKDAWRRRAQVIETARNAIRASLRNMLMLPAAKELRRNLFAVPLTPAVFAKVGLDPDAALANAVESVASLESISKDVSILRKAFNDRLATAIADIVNNKAKFDLLSKAEQDELTALQSKINADTWLPKAFKGLLFDSFFPFVGKLLALRDDIAKAVEDGEPNLKAIAAALSEATNAYLTLTAGRALAGIADAVCKPAGAALYDMLIALTPSPRPLGQQCIPDEAASCAAVNEVPPYVFACKTIAAALRSMDCVRDEIATIAGKPENVAFAGILNSYAATLKSLSATGRTAVERVAQNLLDMETERRALDGWLGGKQSDFVEAVCKGSVRFPAAEIAAVAERRLTLLRSSMRALAEFEDGYKQIGGIEEQIKTLGADIKKPLDEAIGAQRQRLALALAELIEQIVGLIESGSAMLSTPASDARARLREAAGLIDKAVAQLRDVSPVLAGQLDEWRKAAIQPPKDIADAVSAFEQTRKTIHEIVNRARGRGGWGIGALSPWAIAPEQDIIDLPNHQAAALAQTIAVLGNLNVDPDAQDNPEHGILLALSHIYALPAGLVTSDLRKQVAYMALPLVEGLHQISLAVAVARRRLKELADGKVTLSPATKDALEFLLRNIDRKADLKDEPGAAAKLDAEIAELDRIATMIKSGPNPLSAADIESLQRIAGNPAVVDYAKKFEEVVRRLLRADIVGLVDWQGFQQELKTQIASLVPTSIVLDYDFNHELVLPYALSDIIQLQAPDPRLVIRSKTTINALNGLKPKTEVTGSLPPFDIKLFGSALHAVTLKFDTPKFESHDGAVPLKFRIKSVQIGPQLEFLEKLQNYLKLGDGNGLGVVPTVDPLGMRVRYGIGLGTIAFGALSFINVNVNAGAILPFEDQPARFTVALSSRDNPFLISAFPFGGGGYFQVEAEANRLVAFESSMDYGGVAAFGFGPLTGIGRLTSGIFVRKSIYKSAEIEGQFFAGGSAHIACFGVSAALSVRMRQEDNGDMAGSAVYTFGFKLFVKTIEFEVPVWRRQNKGAENALFEDGPTLTRFAEAGNPGVMNDAGGPATAAGKKLLKSHRQCCELPAPEAIDPVVAAQGVELSTHTECQGDNFEQYMKYFWHADLLE
jgi:hypothetical protein